jgi:hypothetical protein
MLSASRQCLAQPWSWTRFSTTMTVSKVKSLTTDRVHTGIQLAISLHRRNVAKGEIEMTMTCVMLSAAGMHVAELKNAAKNDATKGIMITTYPSMTNLTNNAPRKEGTTKEELTHFPTT